MDAGLIKVVGACVIGAHGIGHVLGWLPALGVAQLEGVSSRSWLLTGSLGDGPARLVAGVLFLAPMAGFLVAAAALLAGQPWWRQVAVGSAGLSLAATALYPQAFTTGATIGSVAVNVVVLYGVLVAGWGAEPAVAG